MDRPSMDSPTAIKNWKIQQLLGSGNYSEIYLATRDDMEMAIKIIDRRKCVQYKKELDALMEKHILCKLKKLYDEKYAYTDLHFPFPIIHSTGKDKENLYIIQKYIRGPELYSRSNHVGVLHPPLQRSLVAQLVSYLEVLHSVNVVHRDLKLENIIVSHEDFDENALKQIHIIDFGTALDLDEPERQGAGNTSRGRRGKKFDHWVGTPNFMPPEAIHNRHSDLRNDIWSLGCTIYQLLAGEPPHKAPSDYLVFVKAEYKMVDMCPDMDNDSVDLIMKLLEIEPNDRLGVISEKEIDYSVIRGHPFFKDVEWEQLYKNDYRHGKPPLTHEFGSKLGNRVVKRLQELGQFQNCEEDVDCDYTPPLSLLVDVMDILIYEPRYRTECIQCARRNKYRVRPKVPKTPDVPSTMDANSNPDTPDTAATSTCTECSNSRSNVRETVTKTAHDPELPGTNSAAPSTDGIIDQNMTGICQMHVELRSLIQDMKDRCCQKCTEYDYTPAVIEQYIYIFVRRLLHNIYRGWRDDSRTDDFWTKLSDRNLKDAGDEPNSPVTDDDDLIYE